MLRDWGIALSLANLLFLTAWGDQLGSADYFLKRPPRWPALLGLIVDVIVLAGVFVVVVRVARRTKGPWAGWTTAAIRLAFLGALIVPVDWVRRQATATSLETLKQLLADPWRAVAASCLAAITLVLLVRSLRPVSRAVAWLLLAMLPLVLVTFGTSVGRLAASSVHPDAVATPGQHHVASRSAMRIVWLLFDELDKRAVFGARDQSVAFPELDRLRRQSFFATNAYSPGRQTLWSTPALTTGRRVLDAKVDGLDLLLRYEQSRTHVPWSREATIFSDSRRAGLNTSIVGWYHSYCRVLARDLTNCSWEAYRPDADDDLTFAIGMVRPAIFVVSRLPLADRYGLDVLLSPEWFTTSRRARHLATYRSVLATTVQAATGDPGLLYVHWPIPHTPVIYDRRHGDFAIRGKQDYLDNLALVDRTIGEVRRAMERAGTWDTAVVLVTSDHSWRMAPVQDYRIPFLLKLSTQFSSFEYAPSFETTLTRSLLRAVISGELTGPDKVASWIDRHREEYPLSVSVPVVDP